MKRMRIELTELAARDNLVLATWKAARGKRHRPGVAAFLSDLDGRLASLGASILAGAAPKGQATRFIIHDPKRREISAACFEDRVLHHAILNLAEPRFESALADSVFACRRGRGVHAAVAAVQQGLQRWPWVVQVDVAGYFPAIDHAVLKAQLARLFKGADFLELLDRVIEFGVQPGQARGLPIGALTSQHFANGYLCSADRLLLQDRSVRNPVRYMDDMVWFCQNREEALTSLALLRTHLDEHLRLQLKPRFVLRPSDQGLHFCGYRVRRGVLLAGPRKMRRQRRAVTRLQRAEGAGFAQHLLQRAHDANLAAMLPAQTLHFRQSLWWPKESSL